MLADWLHGLRGRMCKRRSEVLPWASACPRRKLAAGMRTHRTRSGPGGALPEPCVVAVAAMPGMGAVTLGVVATVVVLLALALPGPAFAVADPYQVSVPVPDQSSGARRSAEREALERVLIRLTGDPDVGRRSELAAALRAPQNHFVRSGYARISDRDLAEAHPDARWLLELEADRNGILRLLKEAGIPAWTGRRPEVLVLILREEPSGERVILDPRSDVARTLVRVGRERGLPLSVPLMDLDDQLALDVSELWGRFEGATAPLQERYQPEAILMLRLYEDALGRWVGDWEGEVGGEVFAAALEVPEPRAAAALLVDRLAARLTARYALRLGGDADALWVQVDELADVAAYAGLMRYLAGVSGVSRVQLVQVQDRSVLLRLDSSAEADRLMDLLRLEARLEPDATPELVGDVPVWRARWRQRG